MELETIGRYQLEAVLGEGAMGKVYRAYDPVLKRKVAIKTIRMEVLDTKEDQLKFKARFFREAQIGGKLHHPNIVVIYDMGEHQDSPFIVLELVEGLSLGSLMRAKEPIAPDKLIDTIQQICDALEVAHQEGIVHRDIKPPNIMVTQKGAVKILDFGVAKLVEDKMTKTGQFLGTVKYSSPERTLHEVVDYRSDLFALAIMTHEMMTGATPFPGQSLSQIIYKIVSGEPVIGEPNPVYKVDPRAFEVFMRKALHLNKEQRFQGAREFVLGLRAMFRGIKKRRRKDFDFDTDQSGVYEPTGAKAFDRIEQARNAFRASLDLGQFDQAREQLELLTQLGADTSDENNLLLEVTNREQTMFDEALQACVLEKAQFHYERLAQLGAASPQDHEALTLIYHEKLEETRKSEEKIRTARQTFRKAVQDGNVTVAEKSLKELQANSAALDEEVALFDEMMHMLKTKGQDGSSDRPPQVQSIEATQGPGPAGQIPTHFGGLPQRSLTGFYLEVFGKNGKAHRFPLHEGENVVGRIHDAPIRIPSASVSRRHAVLTVNNGRVSLRDERSLNFTFLNKKRVEGEIVIAKNDYIWFGQINARLIYDPS